MRLVRRHGAGISTAQIAAEAHCSKETLYNWFDDRDGILMALVEEQARGMNAALETGFVRFEGSLKERLEASCAFLLDIMTGDAVVVVNRIAMAQACKENASLGLAVLAGWQEQVEMPFRRLFEEGVRAGVVKIDDPGDAFQALIGLLVGDRQRRLLLGEAARPTSDEMVMVSKRAVDRWWQIFAP